MQTSFWNCGEKTEHICCPHAQLTAETLLPSKIKPKLILMCLFDLICPMHPVWLTPSSGWACVLAVAGMAAAQNSSGDGERAITNGHFLNTRLYVWPSCKTFSHVGRNKFHVKGLLLESGKERSACLCVLSSGNGWSYIPFPKNTRKKVSELMFPSESRWTINTCSSSYSHWGCFLREPDRFDPVTASKKDSSALNLLMNRWVLADVLTCLCYDVSCGMSQ